MINSLKGTRETILVVDDNELVLQTVVALLEAVGFWVLSANNGANALKVAAETEETIHVLLCDVDMPEMSGPHVGKTLKESRPNMHVMLMSGGDNGNLLVLDCGWAYLQKPFGQAKLVKMITDILYAPDAP